ncbi:hypothetical protein [Fodinibius salsisoli]|uniref:DUF4249 domain-containing protein n=1 Tax=Fodinibius salsisoli TaxID=2820877 RepID=A0ABT3PJ40_9BACT|nr:hypothetical protein [Fodinibius salsisoli]MCW9705927.1 hypothetical protein [Fodinibius salsisoli]
MNRFLLLLISIIIISSCELYEQDDYQEYYVVESYLIADSPLPNLLLSKTSPIEEKYSFKDAVVNEAEVEVRLLNADSTIAERYAYTQNGNGTYSPTAQAKVKPKRLYQLYISLSNGDSIEAKTFVPGNFEVLNKDQISKEYTYQSDQQVQLRTTPSDYITDRQTYYIFTINAVNPDSSKLTPFYRDLVIDQENSIENFTINSSGIINEKNYERNADDTITLDVPWLSIAFYDTNKIITNAIDDNMYDFVRTQDAQTGGTSLSPGEIQNIRYHVHGGIGIFGSMASDTLQVQILRPDQQ